jgi:hypothetical protein
LTVVEQNDLIGEAIGFLQVLRGQHERHAFLDEAAEELPEVVAALRIEAGRRLVEEQHRRARDQAGRKIEPPAHAPGERPHQALSCLLEPQLGEQLRGAPAHGRTRQVVETAHELEVRAGREQAVDGGALPRQSDTSTHLGGLGDGVEAGHERTAGGRQRQRREDADGGRLARSVVAEQAEDAAGGSVEARLAQRPDVAVGFGQTVGVDAVGSIWSTMYVMGVRHTTNLAVHCTNVKSRP